MAVDLLDYLKGGVDSPRLWVNFNKYAKNLLLGSDANPWTTPASYLSFYTQAHALVKAEVVLIDIWDLFHHWMEDDENAIKSMSEKSRATFASKVLLEAYAPRELLAEVLIAMNDNYGNSVPIVLVIPSPRSLLARSHQAATKNDLEPTEMSVDTVSMYMADFLRYYSETNLSGILLVEDEKLLPLSAEEIAWYQPVLNVAKHYRWSVGLQLPFQNEGFNAPDEIDFTIIPEQSAACSNSLGVDISHSLWASSDTKENTGFNYFTIPEDINPETVLETLSTIK